MLVTAAGIEDISPYSTGPPRKKDVCYNANFKVLGACMAQPGNITKQHFIGM